MRNMQIEKSLNCKMRPWYLGPLFIVSRNYGGAYIIAKLDGTVFHRPVAAFHIVPTFYSYPRQLYWHSSARWKIRMTLTSTPTTNMTTEWSRRRSLLGKSPASL